MSIMVSVMEFDAQRELCDGGPRFDASTIGVPLGAVIQAPAVVHDVHSDESEADADKDAVAVTVGKAELRLELAEEVRSPKEQGGVIVDRDNSTKSPLSPASNSSKTGSKCVAATVASAIGPQKEVIDDRKALRDALYQGIFHRHRRTIFAMGSFIRMLKSRNSQYNTIRSASDGEDEQR